MKLTAQQRRVVETEGVTLLGVDAKGRPVVSQKERWGRAVHVWALKKDGDPAEVVSPIRKD